MRILYFDCPAGISGDMTLGALMDIGVEKEYLVGELEKLCIDGWELNTERKDKNGIDSNYAKVILKNDHHHKHEQHHEHKHQHSHHEHKHQHSHHEHHHHKHEHHHEHRNYFDIVKIIDDSKITDYAKKLAKAIFMRVAEAESKVHGKPVAEVHFHEVGAVDSIIDIVGTAICIDYLKPDKILSSIVNDGHGFVNCQHGKIPVPVPAVTEIFGNSEAITRQIDIDKELVTPTGAAIIAELAESFGMRGEMKIIKTGYGAGTRDLSIPNILRVHLCESLDSDNKITVIETNIDDSTPEILGYVMDRLINSGAKDVYFTNINMKKNRPAVKISILCDEKDTELMTDILFSETSTIGVRIRQENRKCLSREVHKIKTAYGDLEVKTVTHNGLKKTVPEFESARKLAEHSAVPLRTIYDEAMRTT